MAEELSSEGRCLYCNKVFSQKEIRKHLAKHLAEKEMSDAGVKTKNFFHIEISSGVFFLHILVRGTIRLEKIDYFLRDIWLECCGHLSGFGNTQGEIDMDEKVQNVFAPGLTIFHDYDYGTTTRVLLKALNNYQLNLKDSFELLSRNEPLKHICTICKKEPAVNLCSLCQYDDYSLFCESCSAEHAKICSDFEEFSCLPVVNSPRMGECGYSGGNIDIERDGPYKKDVRYLLN